MKKVVKKIAIIAMAVTMLFGVFGLTACYNVSLVEFKTAKSQALQDYADSKGESNYSKTGWEAICNAVTEGKKAIEDVTTKPAVITAFNDAKSVIDAVEMEDKGLQAGFDSGNGKPGQPIWLGFTTDRSSIAVGEDLTVKLYYASLAGYGSNAYDAPLPNVSAEITAERIRFGEKKPNVNQYFSETIDRIVIKTIDDFTDSTNYPTADVGQTSVAFETITVPANWFVSERGAFVWRVDADIDWESPLGLVHLSEGGSIALYYKVFEDSVILFDSYESFFNYTHN